LKEKSGRLGGVCRFFFFIILTTKKKFLTSHVSDSRKNFQRACVSRRKLVATGVSLWDATETNFRACEAGDSGLVGCAQSEDTAHYLAA
jgi:hypothetical protein